MLSIINQFSKSVFFFFQAEDGIRDWSVTGVQTCALPISADSSRLQSGEPPASRSSCPAAGQSFAGDGCSRFVGNDGRGQGHYLSAVTKALMEDPRLLGREVKRIVYDAETIARRTRARTEA